MKVSVHQPSEKAGNRRPGTAVVEFLGFRGNLINSRGRMDVVAEKARNTMIAVERMGTNATVFDLKTRQALHPTRYDMTMSDSVEALYTAIERVAGHFDRLVGHGVSGGGAPIMALARLGIFERILIRDGVNLRAPESPRQGIPNFLGYLAFGERGKPPSQKAPKIPSYPEVLARGELRHRTRTEIRHYGDLMLSTYTRDTMLDLAAHVDLPVRFVALGHTFSGSPTQALDFIGQLHARREMAGNTLRAFEPAAQAARLIGTIEPLLWHSDLVTRPDIAALHINSMFFLPTAKNLPEL